MKQCKNCGKKYYDGGSKFCTADCRDESYKKARVPWKFTEKGVGICEYCSHEFKKENSSQRFCCKKCYNNSLKKTDSEMTCKFCGISFRSKYEKMYCSHKCSKAYRRAMVEKPIITKKCVECGTMFEAEHFNSKHCSDDCRKEFNRKKRSKGLVRERIERGCKFCGTRFETDEHSKVYRKGSCKKGLIS